jgi:hypothetical protein
MERRQGLQANLPYIIFFDAAAHPDDLELPHFVAGKQGMIPNQTPWLTWELSPAPAVPWLSSFFRWKISSRGCCDPPGFQYKNKSTVPYNLQGGGEQSSSPCRMDAELLHVSPRQVILIPENVT